MYPPAPHQVLAGRFRIEGPLGQGGMGAVYLATDTAIGRKVAIKMLHPELAVEADNLERLREEAFSLASLHHPNILQLFDFHAGGPEATFLVMELLEGETLSARLRAAAHCPVDVAVDYGQQVLSALSAAHAKNIIHRDIKPANLFVSPVPGRRDLVKVLDFGLAKLTEATIRRRPTTAGMLLGTPTYMAPEQTMGGNVDARTDVYAVGLVLYRMLAGANPFEGPDLQTTLQRVNTVVPPDLRQLRGDVPSHVASAIACALAKDPAARFAAALDFARALGDGVSETRGRVSGGPARREDAPTVSQRASTPLAASLAQPQGSQVSRAYTQGPVPRKSTFWLGLAVGLVAMLILGLGAAVVFLVKEEAAPAPRSGDASDPVPILVASIAPPSDASAPTRPAAPTKVAPKTAAVTPTPGAGNALGGNCRCLPIFGSTTHGNNQRLAPTPMPTECLCVPPSHSALCVHKRARDEICKTTTFVAKVGTKCSGHNSNGEVEEGVADECDFPIGATGYAGPAGRPCKGLTVDNKTVDGVVACP